MNAGTAYVFRHALPRDAAVQLQLPTDRARRHALALALIEEMCKGRPTPLPPPFPAHRAAIEAHRADAFAEELAEHARGASPPERAALGKLHSRRAAEHAERTCRMGAAVRLWQSRAAQETGCERAEATRRAGIAAQRSDAAKLAEPKFLDALAQFREAGDPRGEAQALGSLADDRHLRGRNSEAATGPEEALELLRECGDWRAAAIVLSNRAVLRMETGNRQEAAAAMREALEVALAAGDAADGTIVLSNLGPAQVYLGFWRRPKRPAAPSWTVAVPPATGAQPRKRRPILRTPSCGRGGSPT